MIRRRIVAARPAAARLDFFVDDFKKFWPPSAINQWFAKVRCPGKVKVELVEYAPCG